MSDLSDMVTGGARAIELWDIQPDCRWITQEDLDDLITAMLQADLELPRRIISINLVNKTIDGEEHFTEGACIYVVTTEQRYRKFSRLDPMRLQYRIISYDKFMRVLYLYVEEHLNRIPHSRDGRVDIHGFTSWSLCQLFKLTLKQEENLWQDK